MLSAAQQNNKGDSHRFRLSPFFVELTLNFQLSTLNLSQCFGQLVGTRGATTPAVDTFEAGNGLLDLHSFDKRRYALRVAVATANERHLANRSILDRQDDRLRAGALGGVGDGLLHSESWIKKGGSKK